MEFRVILNDTYDGLRWSVSIVYAYGKSEPQFRKINKCMVSANSRGYLEEEKKWDGCMRA